MSGDAVESVRRISVVWDPFTHSKVLMCAGDMPNDSEVVAASDHDAVVATLTKRVELLERALRRSAALIDRLYEGGPDCDCTMDGGSHTCGWPELRATREQNHRALTHAGEKV